VASATDGFDAAPTTALSDGDAPGVGAHPRGDNTSGSRSETGALEVALLAAACVDKGVNVGVGVEV
jgi:hypothetical protein